MFPQEIASRKIIPPLKAILIHELWERGFSQRKISRLLEISQPQVHKYLAKPKEYYFELLGLLGFDKVIIKEYIELLLPSALREDKARLIMIMHGIVDELTMDYMCRTKRYLQDLCRGRGLTDPFIEAYKSFVSGLLSKYDLYKLIPEVGLNIVYAPFKPRNTGDVIGLLGRIIKIGGKARAIGDPIYGGSHHLAKVLIIVNKYNPVKKTAINIRYDDMFLRKLAELNKNIIHTGPHDPLEDFWISMEKAAKSKPDVIADKGGYGLEPIIYVFTSSFDELEEIIQALVGRKRAEAE